MQVEIASTSTENISCVCLHEFILKNYSSYLLLHFHKVEGLTTYYFKKGSHFFAGGLEISQLLFPKVLKL